MLQLPIYLDYNSTTPCDARVVEVMLPYFSKSFGNAASKTHSFGWQAEEAVEYAREELAGLVDAETKEIIFTSGATEAVNLAIKGVAEAYISKGSHIVTSSIEHKAVLDTCRHLEKQGAEITYLPVNAEGLISAGQVEEAIRSNTVLVAIMYANNEIGVIQPIKQIAAIARKHDVLFFCDAAQAVGKIPVDVMEDDISILSVSAHKLYGPKGVGALSVRRKNPRVKLIAQMDGGGHENNMRSGTLNVPAIVGFGKACELCMHEMKDDAERLSKLRDKLENALTAQGNVYVNGSKEHRLPHTTNLSFKGIVANQLMMSFNKDIAVSSGSACTSALIEPSYVLKALGLSDELANASLRFGLGRFTTEDEIDFAIDEISKNLKKLRSEQGVF